MPKPFPSRHRHPTESPGFLLWLVSNDWGRRQAAALEKEGLTHTQFVLLASLLWLSPKEPVTQTRLARHAKTDVMTTSQVVRTLEERGLLKRGPHPTDTRAKCLALTAAGEKLVRQAFPRVEGVNREFFSRLGGRYAAFIDAMRCLASAEESEVKAGSSRPPA